MPRSAQSRVIYQVTHRPPEIVKREMKEKIMSSNKYFNGIMLLLVKTLDIRDFKN